MRRTTFSEPMRRRFRSARSIAAFAAAIFAIAQIGSAASATEDVQSAFDHVLQVLQTAQTPADRNRVERAAQTLDDAIAADGGARTVLTIATRNIERSLRDGSFDARASLRTLRAIAAAPRSVLDAGPWRPSAPYPQTVGLDLHQKGEGDCVGISVLKAFSTTPAGEAILRSAVTRDPNGGFVVDLPGAPDRVFHVPDGALTQYGVGDAAAAAIIGALFQNFGLDPHSAALPTNKVMELLAGRLGNHARLADANASAPEIERYLLENASAVGANVAMVFGGKPAHGGGWSRGDGHAFAVLRIDAASRTVTYTNPWNESRTHVIAISELADEASGTSADFETVQFQAAPAGARGLDETGLVR